MVLVSVKQFCRENPFMKERTLRKYILHYKSNKIYESGAVKRMCGQVLINPPAFFAWIETQTKEFMVKNI